MTGLGTLARRAVRRSTALTCAWYLVDDWRAGQRIARGDFATRSGARHKALALAESLGKILSKEQMTRLKELRSQRQGGRQRARGRDNRRQSRD